MHNYVDMIVMNAKKMERMMFGTVAVALGVGLMYAGMKVLKGEADIQMLTGSENKKIERDDGAIVLESKGTDEEGNEVYGV